MGAGKSSVGRALAKLLGWAFEDLDGRIEKCEGRTIAEIFRKCGESEFRHTEHEMLTQALTEIGARGGKILALGGGAFVDKSNIDMIQKSGVPSIFLDATVEELWRRCCAQTERDGIERPLLTRRAGFSALYETRRRHYLKALIRLETDGKAIDEIANEAAALLTGLPPGGRVARPSRKKSGEKP